MGYLDLSKIQASSLTPGLQHIGTAEDTIFVSGLIDNQANLVGISNLFFPKECMAVIRVNLPDAHGDLASKWFPLMGSLQLYDSGDASHKWYLTLTTLPSANGRTVSFCFTSDEASNTLTLNGFRINLVAHFYNYPWS